MNDDHRTLRDLLDAGVPPREIDRWGLIEEAALAIHYDTIPPSRDQLVHLSIEQFEAHGVAIMEEMGTPGDRAELERRAATLDAHHRRELELFDDPEVLTRVLELAPAEHHASERAFADIKRRPIELVLDSGDYTCSVTGEERSGEHVRITFRDGVAWDNDSIECLERLDLRISPEALATPARETIR